jgi:hypothetical protein
VRLHLEILNNLTFFRRSGPGRITSAFDPVPASPPPFFPTAPFSDFPGSPGIPQTFSEPKLTPQVPARKTSKSPARISSTQNSTSPPSAVASLSQPMLSSPPSSQSTSPAVSPMNTPMSSPTSSAPTSPSTEKIPEEPLVLPTIMTTPPSAPDPPSFVRPAPPPSDFPPSSQPSSSYIFGPESPQKKRAKGSPDLTRRITAMNARKVKSQQSQKKNPRIENLEQQAPNSTPPPRRLLQRKDTKMQLNESTSSSEDKESPPSSETSSEKFTIINRLSLDKVKPHPPVPHAQSSPQVLPRSSSPPTTTALSSPSPSPSPQTFIEAAASQQNRKNSTDRRKLKETRHPPISTSSSFLPKTPIPLSTIASHESTPTPTPSPSNPPSSPPTPTSSSTFKMLPVTRSDPILSVSPATILSGNSDAPLFSHPAEHQSSDSTLASSAPSSSNASEAKTSRERRKKENSLQRLLFSEKRFSGISERILDSEEDGDSSESRDVTPERGEERMSKKRRDREGEGEEGEGEKRRKGSRSAARKISLPKQQLTVNATQATSRSPSPSPTTSFAIPSSAPIPIPAPQMTEDQIRQQITYLQQQLLQIQNQHPTKSASYPTLPVSSFPHPRSSHPTPPSPRALKLSHELRQAINQLANRSEGTVYSREFFIR